MSVLVESARNRFLVPSFELGAGTVEVARNLWRDPLMQTASVTTAQGATVTVEAGGKRVVRTGAPGRASTTAAQRVTVTPLAPVLLTAHRTVPVAVQGSAATDGRLEVVGYDSTGSHRSNAFKVVVGGAPTVGSEVLSQTITPPDWVVSLEVNFYTGGANGDAIIWDRVGVIDQSGVWFVPGQPTPDPDQSASWTGQVNASQSVLTVTAVDGVTSPEAVQSSLWAVEGSKSLRVLGDVGDGSTFGDRMTPFSQTVRPGVTVNVTGEAPGWASYGTLWDEGKIAYPAGEPVESAPGQGHLYGCKLATTGGNNAVSLYGSFTIDRARFGLMLTSWAPTDVTVMVDRQPVAVDPVVTGEGYQLVVIDGLGPGLHQVDFVVGWGSNFLQVVHEPGATVTVGPAPAFRLGLVGDSYADSGIQPYFAGLAKELWLRTGWTIVQLGQGSTGYTNNGSSSGDLSKSVYGSPSRLAALQAGNVDAVLVIGSVNDGSTPPATVQAAAEAYYKALEPLGVPVVVAGVEPLSLPGSSGFDWDMVDQAIKNAAYAAGNVVGVIDWRGEDWLTGTGCVSDPKGDGNQDQFIGDAAGTDTIHPNLAGQRFLAGKFTEALTTTQLRPPTRAAHVATLNNQTAVVHARMGGQFALVGATMGRVSNGVIRVHGTGPLILSSGWWDVLTIVDGEYTGQPFSGDSPPVQGRTFSWAGTPHKSEAVMWEPEKATLTPIPDMNPVPRVHLDIPVSVFPSGAVTVSVVREAEGRTFPVRGGQHLSGVVPAVVTDSEAPFGVESAYALVGFDETGVEVGRWPIGTTTLHYDRPVIQQPLDPRLSVEVRRLVTTAERVTRPTPSELVYPQGRVLPGMIGLGPRRGVEGMALDLFVATHADGDMLQATLGTYEQPQLPIWLVRTPPPQRIPRVFFCHVPEVEEIDINGRIGMEYLQYSATVTEVHPPAAGVVALALRYSDVGVMFDTYSAVGAAYATYSDVKRDESLIGAADA